MRRLIRDWDGFFFEPQTARVLGLYRIAIGLITIYSFLLFAKDVTVFFSDQGVLRVETVERLNTREWHTLLAYVRSPLGVKCMLALLFAAAACFTVGFHTRISSIALFILVVSFHERNNLVLNSGDTVLRTMLFLFMFAPAGAAFSVDSLRRRLRSQDPASCGPLLVAPWAQRMMQLQVALIYFTTVYAKSRGELYHNGSAMYYVFGLVDFSVRGIENLMNYPVLYSALTFGTLFAEIAITFLIWFRATRPYAVTLGILLHLWIMWCMVLPVFGILMVATYIAFYTEEELEAGLAGSRKCFAQRRARVYVDGDCGLCLRARKVMESLDLFGRLEFLNAREGASDGPLPAGVTEAALLETMYLITPQATVLTGFRAYRWIAWRLPATCWMAPPLWLPGVAWAGEHVYRRIAAHRTVSCAVASVRTP
jgi:predicted DCC family thiol-disulfide oxidoreductase YuxK